MNGGPGKYGIGTKPTILGRWDGWRAEEGGGGGAVEVWACVMLPDTRSQGSMLMEI